MPSAQPTATHVDVLQKEMLDYERDIRKLLKGQHSAIHMRNAHKDYYYYLIIKLEQISRQKEHFQAELYNGVITSNTKRLERAESKLRKATQDHNNVQLELPGRLKGYAAAIKREVEFEEAIRDLRNKMVLKQEEIHRLRPCEVFVCDHCRAKKERSQRELQFKEMFQRAVDKFKKFRI